MLSLVNRLSQETGGQDVAMMLPPAQVLTLDARDPPLLYGSARI